MAGLTIRTVEEHLDEPAAWHLHLFDEITSTNAIALEMAEAGAPHRTAVLADSQTAGRGRQGREWRTPRGTAIALSVVVRPSSGPEWWPWIGLAAAVATRDAIERVSGEAGRLKWPNDVLINGRKVAGVLTETRWHPVHAERRAVVAGIGVNVNNRAATLPESFAASATSILDATGTRTDRGILAAEILNGLARELDELPQGADALRSGWTVASATAGSQVAVSTPTGLIEGVDVGLDSLGRLIIRTRDGRTHAVHTGEVLLLRTMAPPVA
jgi:BirA family biotin operon repressor/biotin-[acetyl-CoA-carboxylase] ligase